jgi:hypothetical protein
MSPPRRLGALLLLASAALPAAEPSRVIVLPFTNLSGVERAPSEIAEGFARRLSERGYKAVPAAEVEAFLAAEHVRYLDSLSGPVRQKLLDQLSASAVVFGTIYTFAEEQNAIVGLSARILRADGSLAWAGVAGLSTQDTEGALGLHRITSSSELAARALDTLASDLPAPGSGGKLSSGRARPPGVSAPVTFRSAALEAGKAHPVCLLPLENRTPARLAGRVVSELLGQRLAASGFFSVVEPADLRAALVVSGVHGLRTSDAAELQKLAGAVGSNLVLRGTIYAFKDTSPRNTSLTPELELDLALVDTAAGRVVWTSRIARKGTDYEGLFQRGIITNVVTLTDQAAAEMVRAAERATPAGPARVVRQGTQ